MGVRDMGKNVRWGFLTISRTPVMMNKFLRSLEKAHSQSFKIGYITPLCFNSLACNHTKRLHHLDLSVEDNKKGPYVRGLRRLKEYIPSARLPQDFGVKWGKKKNFDLWI